VGHAIGVLICVELASRTEVKSEGLLRRNSSKIGSIGFAANRFSANHATPPWPQPFATATFLGASKIVSVKAAFAHSFDVV